MRRELKITSDGSKTIYLPEMDETYHSVHGAIQEAKHVFIENGLKAMSSLDSLVIFEMGLGTGLNALLTAKEAKEVNQSIHYIGLEAYPVELEMAIEMDYVSLIGEECNVDYTKIHTVEWGERTIINNYFDITKIHSKIEDYFPSLNSVDLVYFDAFGPRAQGAMWNIEILDKMYKMLKPNGCLVTYCAKGQVKRDLKSVGFELESLPGPPGKREMTRAWKR